MQWNLLCLLGNKVTSGPENFSKKLRSKMQVREIRSALPLSPVVVWQPALIFVIYTIECVNFVFRLVKRSLRSKYRRTNDVVNRRKQGKTIYNSNIFILSVRVQFHNTRRTSKRGKNTSHATSFSDHVLTSFVCF